MERSEWAYLAIRLTGFVKLSAGLSYAAGTLLMALGSFHASYFWTFVQQQLSLPFAFVVSGSLLMAFAKPLNRYF